MVNFHTQNGQEPPYTGGSTFKGLHSWWLVLDFPSKGGFFVCYVGIGPSRGFQGNWTTLEEDRHVVVRVTTSLPLPRTEGPMTKSRKFWTSWGGRAAHLNPWAASSGQSTKRRQVTLRPLHLGAPGSNCQDRLGARGYPHSWTDRAPGTWRVHGPGRKRPLNRARFDLLPNQMDGAKLYQMTSR